MSWAVDDRWLPTEATQLFAVRRRLAVQVTAVPGKGRSLGRPVHGLVEDLNAVDCLVLIDGRDGQPLSTLMRQIGQVATDFGVRLQTTTPPGVVLLPDTRDFAPLYADLTAEERLTGRLTAYAETFAALQARPFVVTPRHPITLTADPVDPVLAARPAAVKGCVFRLYAGAPGQPPLPPHRRLAFRSGDQT